MQNYIKNFIFTLSLGSLFTPLTPLYAVFLDPFDILYDADRQYDLDRQEEERKYADSNAGSDAAESDFQPTSDDAQEFYQAICDNQPDKIVALLDSGTLIDGALDSEFQRTPLIWAADLGRFEIVRILLARGADTKLKDSDGWTALILAITNGHINMAKLLLDNGADPLAQNNYDNNTLKIALLHKQYEMLDLLLDPKYTPIRNTQDIALLCDAIAPALEWTVYENHHQAVDLLLNKMANLRVAINNLPKGHAQQDELRLKLGDIGTKALFATLQNNNLDMAITLLHAAHKHTYNLSRENRITILHNIVRHEYTPAVEEFIDILANLIDAREPQNEDNPNLQNTTLMVAAQHGNSNMVQLLLTKTASPALTNTHEDTALILAARAGNLEAVTTLLDYIMLHKNKSNIINHRNTNSHTALFTAITNGHEDIALALINAAQLKKADEPVDAPDNTDEDHYALAEQEGVNALHFAAHHGLTSALEALVHLGIDVDSLDMDGKTALIIAVDQNKHHAVATLLKLGANKHALDDGGRTALHYVKNPTTVQTLIDAGIHVDDRGYDYHDNTALIHVIANKYKTKEPVNPVVEALLKAKASINLKNSRGETALDIALKIAEEDFGLYPIDYDPYHTVRLLILAGAPLKVSKVSELTDLMRNAAHDRATAVLTARVLAQESALPKKVACLIQRYAETGIPNQAPAAAPESEMTSTHTAAPTNPIDSEEEEKESAARVIVEKCVHCNTPHEPKQMACEQCHASLAKTIQCRACTFANHNTRSTCEMCDASLNTKQSN